MKFVLFANFSYRVLETYQAIYCLDYDEIYNDWLKHTNVQCILSQTKIQSNKNLERPSFVAHLNLDDTINKTNSQNMSFGIKGAVLNNSYGFRMNLDNFQCAKSVNDVSVKFKAATIKL